MKKTFEVVTSDANRRLYEVDDIRELLEYLMTTDLKIVEIVERDWKFETED